MHLIIQLIVLGFIISVALFLFQLAFGLIIGLIALVIMPFAWLYGKIRGE